MRYDIRCLAGILFVFTAGCQSRTAPLTTVSKDQTVALAKQVREAMTDPSIMQLEYQAPRAENGLRSMKQREAGRPFMNKLVACGKAAEQPLWELVNDTDESVRRACVMLLAYRAPWKDEEGNKIDSQTILELNIPIMERALAAQDAVVRYYACGCLADYRDFSDECLERIRLSLPKLRELRNDNDPEVRHIGWTACNTILAMLSTRAKTPEDRMAAADEWKQLQRENW